MQILVAGVRQKTAPIEVRERFSLSEKESSVAIPQLLGIRGIIECAILSTCNRTEIYIATPNTETAMASLKQFFREFKNIEFDQERRATFTLLGEDAILHLFRVAAGLDSLILGEGQILAQIKDTLAQSQNLKASGLLIDRLFKSALSMGKRVRTETGIASRDTSVSWAAYDFAKTIDADLLDKKIALIGGGKMAGIMLSALKNEMTPEQQKNVVIVNRSEHRLETLIQKHGFRGVTWDGIDDVLKESDVLFVATGAPHLVLDTEDFKAASGHKLVIDISVPRNVDPAVGELENITLYNTDNLAGISCFTPETQEIIIQEARAIMNEEYANFHQWMLSLPVVPTLTQLRSKVESIRKAEASCVCPVTETSCSVIDDLSKNLVNKILHDPTVRLKSTKNLEEIYRQAAMLGHLFDIENKPSENKPGQEKSAKKNPSLSKPAASKTPTPLVAR